ncbi:hypothetical protein GLOTRDRAFT_140480 [Gloeophyllum trabeum ATCC 11539]|uniref:F-box domain-containing protein n=1 Tax=Gloeophyllum trabeum (strain ATCC 11539 / FP-39264 / Madison 617) TaxID=670483 RepID=S7PWM1_GLOTA|nr:uncharacterized protein GLOTRDRAFT_140480 [Gloeophyllum trabeum ATCC 11539]EPQ52001.1 hypothetical protein GLOTRDRAFT_140480 [Gloeophyllum trabeum ATCC 11539]
MHPLFCQEDILAQIFGKLVDELDDIIDEDEDEKKRDLRTAMLNAALTSRRMQELALDALWRILDSLYPLFRLTKSFNSLGRDLSSLTGVVTQDEVMRIRAYACRVRKLCYDGADYTPIHPTAYLRLSRIMGSPLLPLLRELKWFSKDLGIQLSSLVTSTLVDVDLSLSHTERDEEEIEKFRLEHSVSQREAVQIVLQDLADVVPNLQGLTLREVLPGTSFKAVHNFKRLRELFIATECHWNPYRLTASVSYDDLSAFSQMDSLRRLVVNVDDIRLSYDATPLTFRALREFKLTGPPSKVAEVLRLVQSAAGLRQVALFLGTEARLKLDYYHSLYRYLSLSTLTHMYLELPTGLQRRNVDAGITLDVSTLIPPLLECRRLEHFHMELTKFAEQPVLMDDDNLIQIAQAWPRLKWFCWNFALDRERRPSIRGLQAFTVHCPRLRVLMIAFDGNVPYPASDEPPRSGHGLRTLVPFGPELNDVADTAQWLYTLFPNIEHITSTDRKWGEVLKVVNALRRASSRARG